MYFNKRIKNSDIKYYKNFMAPPSLVEEENENEIISVMLSEEKRIIKKYYVEMLFHDCDIDRSSIYPNITTRSESFILKEDILEEELDESIDYDMFVRMKPIARYKIEFSKITVKKGKPKIIIDPDEIL